MNETIKAGAGRVAAVGSAVGTLMVMGFVLASSASAAPADPVGAAFGTLQDKVVLYGGLTVALVVSVVVLFFGIKFLKNAATRV